MNRWVRKFRLAARGVFLGVHGQSSFAVHLPAAAAVLVVAGLLRCAAWQWCVLLVCIGCVLAAELANSAIEELAAGLCQEHSERVGRALDIASGAVLVTSLMSATIGAIVFIIQLVNVFAR